MRRYQLGSILLMKEMTRTKDRALRDVKVKTNVRNNKLTIRH